MTRGRRVVEKDGSMGSMMVVDERAGELDERALRAAFAGFPDDPQLRCDLRSAVASYVRCLHELERSESVFPTKEGI